MPTPTPPVYGGHVVVAHGPMSGSAKDMAEQLRRQQAGLTAFAIALDVFLGKAFPHAAFEASTLAGAFGKWMDTGTDAQIARLEAYVEPTMPTYAQPSVDSLVQRLGDCQVRLAEAESQFEAMGQMIQDLEDSGDNHSPVMGIAIQMGKPMLSQHISSLRMEIEYLQQAIDKAHGQDLDAADADVGTLTSQCPLCLYDAPLPGFSGVCPKCGEDTTDAIRAIRSPQEPI